MDFVNRYSMIFYVISCLTVSHNDENLSKFCHLFSVSNLSLQIIYQ